MRGEKYLVVDGDSRADRARRRGAGVASYLIVSRNLELIIIERSIDITGYLVEFLNILLRQPSYDVST